MADHSEVPARQAGLDLLAVQPGEKVLEVGFGTGHCLVALAQAVGPTGKVWPGCNHLLPGRLLFRMCLRPRDSATGLGQGGPGC
jgi:hypothetical protein